MYDNNPILKNLAISTGKEYIINNNFISNNVNKIYSNLNANVFNNLFVNYNTDKNIENKNYNINNNVINNDINNIIKDSNSTYFHNKKPLNKILFIVTHVKKKKKVMKNHIKFDNNNEIKVFKNNKFVYVNSSLLKPCSTYKNIKEFNNITFITKSKRSSKYRGVSKNGNKWQVLMMNNKKSYIGSYDSEELAGRIYDKLALKYKGIKAKTNFKYTNQQIKNICENDINLKEKNIYDIISQLPNCLKYILKLKYYLLLYVI